MRNRLLILFLGVVAVLNASADDKKEILIDGELFKPQLNAYLEYGYNYTWRNYGDIELQALLPINRHFDMDVMAHFSTANVYSVGANMRPKFPLPIGNMYLETRLSYRAIVRNGMHNFSAALSLGYEWDYVRVQLGAYSIMFSEFNRKWHRDTEIFIEAPSLLYGVDVNTRPNTCNWNIGLRVSNYNDYSIERMWQPLFALNGRYDIDKHLKLLAEVELKPTGMFHLDASFYGITARVGVGYKF